MNYFGNFNITNDIHGNIEPRSDQTPCGWMRPLNLVLQIGSYSQLKFIFKQSKFTYIERTRLSEHI